jgi:hypothetical protein
MQLQDQVLRAVGVIDDESKSDDAESVNEMAADEGDSDED